MADGNAAAGRIPSGRVGGRVRSESARAAVLGAATDLLDERGYAAITMEGVASRSGVAKSTIYRWWKSKPALVMEAHGAAVAQRMPEPDTGTTESDLIEFTEQLYRVTEHPRRVAALRGMMADAQLDPEFGEHFRAWVNERREIVAVILTRGMRRGELAADLDVEYAVDLIFGPFWYRLLVEHAPLDAADVRSQIRRLLTGFVA
ncbi:TetR/AcrR family transcriptional regulator [Nocardia cyriacigeorgica]|uniref:TetR/AcrR family transcriptional regulator n=1 Tax=Nocardia cyriacigeorgica TaxID=135487 RepID=UPI0013B6A183|nr:TetR/AcrR family transcriptional regulator [Nocardia cyriacigeorgica]NEW50078.1 TetR/AcrR family transcriptional regulator [Nocardia cyriacigeorgica]